MRFRLRVVIMAWIVMFAVARGQTGLAGTLISITLDRGDCAVCNRLKADVMARLASRLSPVHTERVVLVRKGQGDLKRLVRWAGKMCPHADIVIRERVPFDGVKVVLENGRIRVWQTDQLYRDRIVGEILEWIRQSR